MGQAFAEAQRAVMQVPDDEPDGNDLSPSTTMVVGGGGRGASRSPTSGTAGPTGWVPTPRAAAPHRRRLLGAGEHRRGIAPEVAYAHPDAHTITRWVGADADSVVPPVVTLEVTEPGLLVLCTDGLWNYFEDPVAARCLVPDWATSSPMAIARRLTDAALAAGGQDNITVVVAPVGPAGTARDHGPTEE